LFGERYVEGDKANFRSPEELTYTTKQAIQEGFILDVTANYTPVDSFYHVAKTVEDDPDFDKAKALKKIRRYVESHDKAIRRKAEIMVDHFTAQVVGAKKIGGKARAMRYCVRRSGFWKPGPQVAGPGFVLRPTSFHPAPSKNRRSAARDATQRPPIFLAQGIRPFSRRWNTCRSERPMTSEIDLTPQRRSIPRLGDEFPNASLIFDSS
jgi:hypothetical protein